MAYRCPVCDHPQSDGRHLANHLAFTALIRGGDHESWLDARVPEWDSLGEGELADRLVEEVEPAAGDLVGGEQSVADGPDVSPGDGAAPHQRAIRTSAPADSPDLPDGTVQEILEEARALTSERRTDRTDETGRTDETESSADE